MIKDLTIRRSCIITFLLVFVMTMSGCGWWKDLWSRKQMAKGTPEALYQSGVAAYQDGRYKRAVEYFIRVKEENPLNPLALQAELGIGDAHFSDEEYAEAELAYTDFVSLHPTNENIPYAMYQLGMCHYKQTTSIDRDQTETIKAAREFERLMARYPSSKFAFLAEQKLRECRKNLAEQEFYIGEFYFKQGKFQAALKRFQTIAKNYPNLGLDYKVKAYIDEAQKRQVKEKEKKAQDEKKAQAAAAKVTSKKIETGATRPPQGQ
ncbi:MAG: outer membrane protein assembly factor BamD [Syntrophales bacterium]|jgi:outer membrane protein assembly factor BamD|nr:outer membrane protein assembly factor BamD [Syntrophales bacterium]MCK9391881.1 outer membrane protein assembly factor BamD [Syntrophales bacterium]